MKRRPCPAIGDASPRGPELRGEAAGAVRVEAQQSAAGCELGAREAALCRPRSSGGWRRSGSRVRARRTRCGSPSSSRLALESVADRVLDQAAFAAEIGGLQARRKRCPFRHEDGEVQEAAGAVVPDHLPPAVA